MDRLITKVRRSSTLSVMLNLLVKSALILLIAPIGIKFLPDASAVTWALAINLVSLTLLFDLGISAIISRHVTASLKSQVSEERGIGCILPIARRIYKRLAVFFGLVVVALSAYLFAGQSDGTSAGLVWVLLTTALFGPLYLYYNFYYACLVGLNQVAFVNFVQATSGLIWYCLAVGALYFKESILSLVLIYIGLLQPALIFRRRLQLAEGRLELPPDSALLRQVMREVYRASFGVGMSLIIYNAISYYYSTEFKGSSSLLAALVLLQMLRGASAFCQSPFYSKLPVINALYASKEYGRFYSYAFRRMSIALVMQVFVFAVVYYSMVDVRTKIIHLVPDGADSVFFALLAIALVMERCAAMLLQVHTACGKVIWHVVNGLSGCAQLLLTYFLSSSLLLNSFPAALMVSVGLVQFPIIIHALRREHLVRARAIV